MKRFLAGHPVDGGHVHLAVGFDDVAHPVGCLPSIGNAGQHLAGRLPLAQRGKGRAHGIARLAEVGSLGPGIIRLPQGHLDVTGAARQRAELDARGMMLRIAAKGSFKGAAGADQLPLGSHHVTQHHKRFHRSGAALGGTLGQFPRFIKAVALQQKIGKAKESRLVIRIKPQGMAVIGDGGAGARILGAGFGQQ